MWSPSQLGLTETQKHRSICGSCKMSGLLLNPRSGRRRFIFVAFLVTLALLYFSQQTETPWHGVRVTGPDREHVAVGKDDYHAHDHHPDHPSAQDIAKATRVSPSSLPWVDHAAEPAEHADSTGATANEEPCPPSFLNHLKKRPGPKSDGFRELPYVRPQPHCRTFNLPEMEELMAKMKNRIKDPDLFRLFENAYPNTLDTMVKWRGYANEKQDMELTYVITGDIDAMWLRDSASQIYSYLPLLQPSSSPDSLASLWRGLINSHSRYIIISPYCHSFQPPPESGINPTRNGANPVNHPNPPFDATKVFDCKWELDSLGSFLQISSAYYSRTEDIEFFKKFVWVDAVEAAVNAAGAMRLGTYAPDGHVEHSAYTFTGQTTRGSETLTNDGLGNPVQENGMVRSSFRPSDDACIFQLLTPSNMLWGKYLEEASHIMAKIDTPKAKNLTIAMRKQAREIRKGIAKNAVIDHPNFGPIFAYEVDGYGSANMMDDSNIPSLLSMPLFNWTECTIPDDDVEASSTDPTRKLLGGTGLVSAGGLTRTAADGGSMRSTTSLGMNPKEENDKKTEEKSERQVTGNESGQFHQSFSPAKNEGSNSENDDTGKIPTHNYTIVYQHSRKFILSPANPYYMWGPVISAVGGPHIGPGKAWPMSAIVAAMTAYDPISGIAEPGKVVEELLRMLLDSTDGFGVIHESIDTFRENRWSRAWFGWANGLFGELILRIAENEREGEGLLAKSYQDRGRKGG